MGENPFYNNINYSPYPNSQVEYSPNICVMFWSVIAPMKLMPEYEPTLLGQLNAGIISFSVNPIANSGIGSKSISGG